MLGIARGPQGLGARQGQSLTTDETGLNAALADGGVRALEGHRPMPLSPSPAHSQQRGNRRSPVLGWDPASERTSVGEPRHLMLVAHTAPLKDQLSEFLLARLGAVLSGAAATPRELLALSELWDAVFGAGATTAADAS